jgi:3-methylfumaryl-CoA hydratase
MWHYGLFLATTPTDALDTDGHSPRGGFLPDVRLPRRMFAGSSIVFHAPLKAKQPATKMSEVAAVDLRTGKSGQLLFVRVKIAITQEASLCVEEEQTLVYRDLGAPQAAITPLADRAAPAPGDWRPDPVELFRFSAITFNSHRIHFDAPYVTGVEGYPGLVVHGPLIAMRLCALAEATAGALRSFSFRAEAPLFVDQPVRLTASVQGRECHAIAERCDGVTAMKSVATF